MFAINRSLGEESLFYRKILVPLDGSAFSEHILAHLPAFITPHKSTVILLHVESAIPVTSPSYSDIPADTDNLWNGAQKYLEKVKKQLASLCQVQIRVETGHASTIISDIANVQQVDLIAMTTHARGRLSRWVLGSIADQVLRTTSQPVLLVCPFTEASDKLRDILVPLDGSNLAENALPQAQALAKEKKARLLLVRVIEDNSADEPIFVEKERLAVRQPRQTEAAKHYLSYIEQELQIAGIKAFSFIKYPPRSQAILRVAKQQKANLILMSTHARAGLRRWVYGSTAEMILREAPCPVLVIRK